MVTDLLFAHLVVDEGGEALPIPVDLDAPELDHGLVPFDDPRHSALDATLADKEPVSHHISIECRMFPDLSQKGNVLCRFQEILCEHSYERTLRHEARARGIGG